MENKTPFTRSWPFTILLILLLTFVCGIISGILGIGFSGAVIGTLIGAVIAFTRFKKSDDKAIVKK
jgi:membrane associated rhomboid family serine protease